jgi:very-short-patch-repair endonuclease
LSTEGRLLAAILYAGPGAALSHETAAWWWQLLDREPRTIDVVTPHRRSSLPSLRLHHRPGLERVLHRGLPVTSVPETLLGVAATSGQRTLRRALAKADFKRWLDLAELDAARGRGRPGSAGLLAALRHHLPQYSRTLSPLEDLFLDLCRAHDLPMPEVNVEVEGFKVDALWREQRLVVELDGGEAHGTPAAVKADRGRDLALRLAGYLLRRYSWDQVAQERARVAVDLRTALAAGVRRVPRG